jgi:hypothetical protein
MERFWNIVYYFAYRGYFKLHLITNKFNPILYLYKNMPFFIRHFEKKGYNPKKVVNEAWERPDIGISNIFASGLMYGIIMFFFIDLHLCYFAIFSCDKVPSFEAFIYPLFVYIAISCLINYILLNRKDKYLKYFKEFNKKPRKWKVKWAWISLGVILFPFIFLAFLMVFFR